MKTRVSKKVLLVIVVAAAAAGLVYLITGLVCVPDVAQFEVTGELVKGASQMTVEPFITYTGMRRVTISSARPLFFVDVYTAEDVRVLQVPVLRHDIMQHHTLRPNVPYNEKDRWRAIGTFPTDYLEVYTFRLEQAGSYKVVVRATFSIGKDVRAQILDVCSEPIWVQIR